jgi:hypothetical protein
MKTLHILLLTASAALLAAAPGLSFPGSLDQTDRASLPPGGMLRTMPEGEYECALPGDAGGEAYRIVASETFRIETASRYRDSAGSGTYILRGKRLTFTGGPRNGEEFERVGQNQLRKLDANGEAADLLCTRLGSR